MIAAMIVAQTSSGSGPSGLAPVADFIFSDNAPSVGTVVTCEDTSTNSPTSWQWLFNGDLVSTAQYFDQYLGNPGWQTFTLTATNAFGSDTKSQQLYVSP